MFTVDKITNIRRETKRRNPVRIFRGEQQGLNHSNADAVLAHTAIWIFDPKGSTVLVSMPQGMSIQIFSPLYTRYKHFRQSSSLALQSLDIHAVPHCHQELGRLSIVELVVTMRNMAPRIRLLTTIVKLVKTGADNRLGIFQRLGSGIYDSRNRRLTRQWSWWYIATTYMAFPSGASPCVSWRLLSIAHWGSTLTAPPPPSVGSLLEEPRRLG